MSTVINFYRTDELPYGVFSNFAAFPFELDGQIWPIVEHYYQAQKVDDAKYRERILLTKSPMVAAQIRRSRGEKFRPDWNAVRVKVMRRALRAKFTRHSAPGELLLATGHAELVEHTANDSFWTDGGDGSGANMLGRLLMQIRDELAAGYAEPII